jgi:hypothetical protein
VTASLAEVQARFLGICLDRDPGDVTAFAMESERARVLLYRDMVRWRFHQIARDVLPRTRAAVGEARFEALVDAWIGDRRPRSRFFRELPLELSEHALEGGALPPLARDLLLLERARWRATIAQDGAAPAAFSLEAIPVPAPSLSVFEVEHAVQLGGGDAPGRTLLAVYRRPDLEVETRWSTPTLHALLSGWALGQRPAIETVREVLAAEGRTPTPAFVDEMSAFLAELIERGAILGSR